MIKTLLHFFRGYLLIEIRGNALERFITQIVNKGIDLRKIQRIKKDCYRAEIKINDYNKLRPIVKRRLCYVEIIKKCGFPFIFLRAKRRYFLLIGILVFVLIFWISSFFIWFIKIDGLNKIPEEKIYTILSEFGVRPGILKSKLNLSLVEEKLLQKEPRIVWANLTWQGTRLNVKIVERKTIDKEFTGNIIAQKDGVISKIIVLKGRAAVREGDTVTSGQPLIVGLAAGSDKEKKEAQGIVRANVWYKGIGTAKINIKETVPTGRMKTIWGIRYNNRDYRLLSKPSFEKYVLTTTIKKLRNWRNFDIPLEFIIEKYKEVEFLEEDRSEDTALFIAKEKAMEKALSKLGSRSIILDIKSKKVDIEGDNQVKVEVLIKAEENIGKIDNKIEEDPSD